MKKIKQFAITFVVSSILVSPQLYAADVGRFYMGAELGSSRVSGDGPKNDSAFISGQEFKASDSSYGVYAGFQFNNWFAAELGFTDFGSINDRFKFKDGIVFLIQPNDIQTVDAKGASLSGVFSYPVTSSFSVLGILGVAAVNYDVSMSGGFSPFAGNLSQSDDFSDQGLLYGIGAKFALNDSFSVRTQMRRSEIGNFTFDLLGLGIEYSF